MIVSHRATAVLEARLRHLNDRDTSQAWTLAKVRELVRQGGSAEALRVEIETHLDGCARRLAELDTLARRELDKIDGKTFPDETDD